MKLLTQITVCLLALAAPAWTQEVTITGFPLSVGGSVEPEFVQPYLPQLQTVAGALQNDLSTRAIVTGGADGTEFRRDHDAKNPGLALGRAHWLRDILIVRFGIDSTRITVQSQESKASGAEYRFASVRIVKQPPDLSDRVAALENRPPIEKHFTEIKEVPSGFVENFGLQVGGGISTTPFGGVPMLTAAVTWKRVVFVEGTFGYTVWNDNYHFLGVKLDTRRRQVGVVVACFPWLDIPVGGVAGWTRIEEVSQRYYDYVRLSEGPMFGIRVTPLEYLSVTAAWNPSKYKEAGSSLSQSKDDQFLVSLVLHKMFGGGK